jgi:hypothetical protein
MTKNDLKIHRKKFLDDMLGSWESEDITNFKNERYRLILTFNKKFGLTNNPVIIKANQKYSSNDIRECTLTFYWVDCNLQISNMELKQGMFKKISSNEIGVYKSNMPFLNENLVLKFKHIK